MKRREKNKITAWAAAIVCGGLLFSCASIDMPSGGLYDETPPVFLSSSPVQRSVNNHQQKLTLRFDEFIKLQNASEKVIVSPPQLEQPELKANGKNVVVELQDSLKHNTTYTVDFGDAIVDNNEENPMGQFTFMFSTGDRIDTLEVSGTVLEAETLEPVKGILVGLHSDLSDTAFTTRPFDRVSRTDASGRFIIRGVAEGTYKIYALQDANQNFFFDQKNEMIAFSDSLIVPYVHRELRKDTIWADSLTIDTVLTVEYSHFYPDNIVLRAFTEEVVRHYLAKSERNEHHKMSLVFSAKADTLPTLRGVNFDEKDAFVVEASSGNDTIIYWLRDSLLYHRDTLEMSVTYMVSVDSLDYLVERTDTLSLVPKKSRAKIVEAEQKAYQEAEKKFMKEERKRQRKAEKEGEEQPLAPYVPPVRFLNGNLKSSGKMSLSQNVILSFDEPLTSYKRSAVHLYQKVDTLWHEVPFLFEPVEGKLREYVLKGNWRPEGEYKLTIDSAAFVGLYGLHTNRMEQKFEFRSLDEYGTVFLTVPEVGDSVIIELLDAQGKTKQRAFTDKQGSVGFYFLLPGKYYFRLIVDENRNGKWDTGRYEDKRQPEPVYYYPRPLEVRALWDYNQDDWDINVPLNKQKPLDITKQKPEEKKQRQSRNEERRQNKKR